MTRIASAIILIAAVACRHASSLASSQHPPTIAADSSLISYDELQADAHRGYMNVYDALKSTHPEMLKSSGGRGWPEVFVIHLSDEPPPLSGIHPIPAVTQIRELEKIPTSQVKWIRRYWSISAPLEYKSVSDWSLVVALR